MVSDATNVQPDLSQKPDKEREEGFENLAQREIHKKSARREPDALFALGGDPVLKHRQLQSRYAFVCRQSPRYRFFERLRTGEALACPQKTEVLHAYNQTLYP